MDSYKFSYCYFDNEMTNRIEFGDNMMKFMSLHATVIKCPQKSSMDILYLENLSVDFEIMFKKRAKRQSKKASHLHIPKFENKPLNKTLNICAKLLIAFLLMVLATVTLAGILDAFGLI